jgi:NTE family protein
MVTIHPVPDRGALAPTGTLAPDDPRPVTLALQGGGALGAFSWGALDRLLDEPRLRITVASGASAGAMNAAMLVQGLATGGPAEAKRLLEAFWRRVAIAAGSPDLEGAGWLRLFFGVFGPVAGALRRAAQELPPPPLLAPLGPNPLRGVLDGLLDPSAFGKEGAPTLVVSATRVRTGEARLFRDVEVTAEVLLASACLPQLFPPVEIDGEPYWDGGYASNPPLRPLIEAGAPADVILVPTAPRERPEPPRGAADIRERAAEIAFGTALRQELRSLAVAQRLLAELPEPPPPGSALARLLEARLHVIGAEEALRALPGGSALDARWGFLRRLRDLGHEATERWLGEHLAAVGVRPTLDLAPFAGPAIERRAEDGRPSPPCGP